MGNVKRSPGLSCLTEDLRRWRHARTVMNEGAREFRKELDKAHGRT